MKKSILLFVFHLSICFLPAQTYYKWAGPVLNAYGNNPSDKLIVTDASGNVYATGSFMGNADFDFSASTATLTSSGTFEIFIAKYDSSGNYLWAKNIGATGGARAYSIAIDAAKNIYITGEFQNTVDFDPGAGTANLTSTGSSGFIAKFDSLGNYIWAKDISGTCVGYSINLDHSGKLVLAGKYTGAVDFDPGAGTALMSTGGGFIAKYDTAGAYVWAKTIGNNRCVSASTDNSDNIYVTGNFDATADFDPSAATANLTAVGSTDIFVAAYTSSGNYSWAFRIGKSSSFDYDAASSIIADPSGDIYVSGVFNQGNVDFDPGPGTANLNGGFFSSDKSLYVAKYSSAGTYIWAFRTGLGGIFTGEGGYLNLASNGDLYVTGMHYSDTDLDPGAGTVTYTSQGGSDMFVARYSPAGSYIESFSIGGQYMERPYSIAPDTKGNIFLMGNFASNMDFDPTSNTAMLNGGGGSGSMVIAKYGACTPVSITSHPASATVCPGSSVTYSTSATGDGLVYQWQSNTGMGFTNITDDGFYFSGATTPTLNVMHIGTSTNVAQYQCLISGSCSAPVACDPATLTILQPPAVMTPPVSTPVCVGNDTFLFVNASGSNLTYQWQINSGSGFFNMNNTPSYSGVTTDTLHITNAQLVNGHMYRCVITGACGLITYSTVAFLNVHALPIVGAWASATTICAGDSVTLSGLSANSYTWSDGIVNNVAFVPASTNTYTVTGTDNNSCSNTATITVNVNSLPVVAAGASAASVCQGSAVTLTGVGTATAYTWSGGVSNGVAFAPVATQSYTVTGTDANNCRDTASILITVIGLPDNTTSLSGNTLTASENGAIYQWIDCNNSFQPIAGETSQSYTGQTGSYAVIVTANGCSDTSQCEAISITSLQKKNGENIEYAVYPNPSSDLVTVTFNYLPEPATIEIVNAIGQLFYHINTNETTNSVSLDKLEKGLYFVRINIKEKKFCTRLVID